MSSPIRDDDADKPIPSDSPWASDAQQQDETLRLQEEVIAAAQRLEQQSLERESWVSLEREAREREARRLPQGLAFQERTPLQLQTPRQRFELAKVQPSENRFSLQESPRGLWAPTLDPISMPAPLQEKFGLPGPGLVRAIQFAPASPEFSAEPGAGKNRSFAAVADNLPRIAAAETKVQPGNLAAAATASVLATVPPDVALAKPSVMTPPPAPTVEAATRAEPAQPEPAKPSASVIPEARPADNMSRDDIASLLKRGQDLVAGGDIASGRLFLTRAAQAGNTEAALALGGTFDAAVLANLRAVGVQPDPAKARAWYMRAAEQGSVEAKLRLQQSALR